MEVARTSADLAARKAIQELVKTMAARYERLLQALIRRPVPKG